MEFLTYLFEKNKVRKRKKAIAVKLLYFTIPVFFIASTFTNDVIVDKCEDIYYERERLRIQIEALKEAQEVGLQQIEDRFQHKINKASSDASSMNDRLVKLNEELAKAKESIASLKEEVASKNSMIARLEKSNKNLKRQANSPITLKRIDVRKKFYSKMNKKVHTAQCSNTYGVMQNGKIIAFVKCLPAGSFMK